MPQEIAQFNIGGRLLPAKVFKDEDGTYQIVQGLEGQRLEEQLRETAAVSGTLTFADEINAIEIYHEAATWQTFTVNSLTLTVPPGGYRTLVGGTPGMTVGIPAGVACIVGRLE